MGASSNAAPVIIKRKKVVGGDGHHGGAWKVAYADFVTAMMAFFMLMWLLNATTEQQRKGIADYFSPTIPINRISGGGDGAFGGDNVFSEQTLPQNGTGASLHRPTEAHSARGSSGLDSQGAETGSQDEELELIEDALFGKGGESMVTQNALRHVITRVTDEGLVIELFSLEDAPLFEEGTDRPTQLLRDLAQMLGRVTDLVTNPIAIGGHVSAQPIVLAENPVWELSSARAERMRQLFGRTQLDPERIRRVTGHADRTPVVQNTMAVRNNRIEVTLLRSKG
ncbi:flagellar motor protein MotB [Thalassococcus sp. S3]|uniref:OmpA/MotB family protein n=1 Tax=Thalassococcus sp. S3 TaxID=2017482 RepID=UPI001024352F|nr:flagellar motor protein MotB [Thalassococcus sp. S3]QBF29685.1 chemotaxis protein MotB [Thalassococcus sp. S3]